MINSMTGFASKRFIIGKTGFAVEIKSYNHRFLDVAVKTPRQLYALEGYIKKEVTGLVERGKVDVYISVTDSAAGDMISMDKLAGAVKLLKKIKSELNIKAEIGFQEIFLLKDLFISGNAGISPDKAFLGQFQKQFRGCIDKFLASRRREGNEIKKDMRKRLKNIESLTAKVEKLVPEIKERLKSKLKKRVEEIFGKENLRERLEQEITFLLDKMDVSEEIMRLKTHLGNFAEIIAGSAAAGKKLDFYTQELLREVNTLSVKSQDARVSEYSIEIKAEIEKIREQVQNVE